MKLNIKISISSVILGATTFVAAFYISDNDSTIFKIILAIISLVIFSASTALATGAGYALSKIAYQIYGTITGTSEYNPDKPGIHIKVFERRFFIAFLLLTTAVFLKFLTDFLFSQHTALYLFFTGACGVFNSGFVTNILSRHKKPDVNILKK